MNISFVVLIHQSGKYRYVDLFFHNGVCEQNLDLIVFGFDKYFLIVYYVLGILGF